MGKMGRTMQWLLLSLVLVGCRGAADTPAVTGRPSAAAPNPPAVTAAPRQTPATEISDTQPSPAAPTSTTERIATTLAEPALALGAPLQRRLLSSYTFPNALSIAASLTADGTLYVALGQSNYLYVARSTDGAATFGDPVQVSESQPAMVLPVERPAIAATATGQVMVAWSSPELQGRIWQAFSADGGQSFSDAAAISVDSATETILPRMILDGDQNPLVAWLANGSLQLARSTDGGTSYGATQLLDEQTCECCHPQPLILGEQIYVAYRNLESTADGTNIRDIYLLRSLDGGQSFAPEIRVSDANWFVNACPVSGPALVGSGDRLYVGWMDGRHDAQGNFSQTDIWLATSTDGGQTFSANWRVNPQNGYHNLPELALDEAGRLHITWIAREAERAVIYYARSLDQGQTFSQPLPIVDSQEGNGPPGSSSLLAAVDGTLYLTWVDFAGAPCA